MPLTPDPDRTHRILDEVIVDCKDEVEQLMSWYYYLSDNLAFPIEATVRFALKGGKTELKPAQIVDIDPKSEHDSAIHLSITKPGKPSRFRKRFS